MAVVPGTDGKGCVLMVEMLSVTQSVVVQLHAVIKPIMSETGSMDETGRALLEGH